MTGAATNGGHAPAVPGTVFFLSDYGLRDEFVGVVHAVLRRLAPDAAVIDLTHDVPPFDVRAGAEALLRTVPHLGRGVVLGVVDPGVGGGRRGLAIECAGRPLSFVGPDNGLLVPAVEAVGGVGLAVELEISLEAATFDGRDVFAPATAALCGGTSVAELGEPVPPGELVRVPAPVCEIDRTSIRAEVTWVDRFGNVQLAAPADALPDSVPMVVAGSEDALRVRTFADLEPGGFGVLADANGRLALVVREGSAALRLGVGTGDLVAVIW